MSCVIKPKDLQCIMMKQLYFKKLTTALPAILALLINRWAVKLSISFFCQPTGWCISQVSPVDAQKGRLLLSQRP